MLIEFKAKNYRSFRNEFIFSLVPAPKQKGLDYSIMNEQVGSKSYKALSTAVIYGPNASGKTNIIGAMDVFRSIILRGNIRNSENRNRPNAATYALELIPNCLNRELSPTDFSIKFIENHLLFEYRISLDIGGFLDSNYHRRILVETLSINGRVIFNRNDKLSFDNLVSIKEYLVNEFENNERVALSIAKSNLNDEELFLVNGFKAMVSSKLASILTNWLENKFIVIYRADAVEFGGGLPDPKKNTVYIEKTVNEAAQIFGINSNALGYVLNEDDNSAELISLFKSTKKSKGIPAELFESFGTIRFANIFPFVIKALVNGGTLVVDEFDASIHPMALMNIIGIFHNDDVNVNHAQLIFDTHNPIFLNRNLLRRDEIKFVERDDATQYSIHYSLSDFGTSGSNGGRNNNDYMKNYFINRYGAIKDIDFTSILENMMKSRKEV